MFEHGIVVLVPIIMATVIAIVIATIVTTIATIPLQSMTISPFITPFPHPFPPLFPPGILIQPERTISILLSDLSPIPIEHVRYLLYFLLVPGSLDLLLD